MNNVYYVGSGELTFDLIERIINENLKLELAPEAKLRIQKCRDYLDKKIAESEEPLYGITTGFGSLCSKSISSDELGTLQENLIKSHACSVGEEIRPVIIKLMMLLKAHALSLGHSGVQVITVQRILDFFNNDVMPIVYDRGSLGASGDLAPLANLFLPLIGVGDVYYKGKKREAISVLDEFGWEPVKLMSKEGLALLNGTQFMSANGVFAILKAFRLSKKADLIAALSLEAFDGRIDPFMDCIQQIRPHKGQIETGANFRKLLEGSELVASPKQHVQDPYSFRCIPQVHGATKDAIRYDLKSAGFPPLSTPHEASLKYNRTRIPQTTAQTPSHKYRHKPPGSLPYGIPHRLHYSLTAHAGLPLYDIPQKTYHTDDIF